MVKFFDDQYKTHGFHNWTCQNCTVAYHKFNVRICKLEKRFDAMSEKVEENTKENASTKDKLDQVDKEVIAIKDRMKTTKQDAVTDATKAWSAELREREARKTNLIIYGLQEPGDNITSGLARKKEDEHEVLDMFNNICAVVEPTDIKFAHRLGPMREDVSSKPRPLRVSFRDIGTLEQVFSRARNLPRTRFKGVSLTPDLTEMQRTEDQELMAEADRLNAELDENEALNWIYRCTGRKGQRVINKLKVRSQRTNRRQTGQHTRTETDTDTDMTDTDETTSSQTNRRKRTRQDSPGNSPDQRPANKQTRALNH